MLKILYIGDYDDNLYKLTLHSEGLDRYEVFSVGDSAEGVAKAAATMPDLVLMDLKLPVIVGREATRRLKADPATRDIPIFALTAHAMAGDRRKAMAAGTDDCDTKPASFRRLLGKIEKALLGR